MVLGLLHHIVSEVVTQLLTKKYKMSPVSSTDPAVCESRGGSVCPELVFTQNCLVVGRIKGMFFSCNLVDISNLKVSKEKL